MEEVEASQEALMGLATVRVVDLVVLCLVDLGVAEAGVLGQPLIRVRALAHSLVEVQVIGTEAAAQEHLEAEVGGLPT